MDRLEPHGLWEKARTGECLSKPEEAGLLALLGDNEKNIQRRTADACASRVDLRDALLRLLGSEEARTRWGSVYALSLQGRLPPAALPVLIEALGNADGDIRWAARELLLREQDHLEIHAALLAAVRTGTGEQRKMIAYVLRDLRKPPAEAETVAMVLLEDPEARVRLAALTCVARLIHGAKGGTCLRAKLTDPDAGVRRAAAATLGALGDREPETFAALERARNSPDPSLRRAATNAIEKLGHPRQGSAIQDKLGADPPSSLGERFQAGFRKP